MEYLTLQDIPHRQYDPLHSHRMASSQPTERPLGSMAAAVSPTSSHTEPRDQPTRSFSFPYLPEPRQERDSGPSISPHPQPCNCSNCSDFMAPSIYFRAGFGHGLTRHARKQMHRRIRNSRTSFEDDLCDIFLTNSQNAQMRSSPPIQPNEHGYADKLPSFSEVRVIFEKFAFGRTDFASFSTPHEHTHRRGHHLADRVQATVLRMSGLNLKT